MKIATELHRPTWVSLPLVDAILRDDVLISFITPPEFQTEPNQILIRTTLHTIMDSFARIYLAFRKI